MPSSWRVNRRAEDQMRTDRFVVPSDPTDILRNLNPQAPCKPRSLQDVAGIDDIFDYMEECVEADAVPADIKTCVNHVNLGIAVGWGTGVGCNKEGSNIGADDLNLTCGIGFCLSELIADTVKNSAPILGTSPL
ncbi:hypothetical protein TWF281_005179 [Arthrobotrys megalospora]